jgi:hypothetical protein
MTMIVEQLVKLMNGREKAGPSDALHQRSHTIWPVLEPREASMGSRRLTDWYLSRSTNAVTTKANSSALTGELTSKAANNHHYWRARNLPRAHTISLPLHNHQCSQEHYQHISLDHRWVLSITFPKDTAVSHHTSHHPLLHFLPVIPWFSHIGGIRWTDAFEWRMSSLHGALCCPFHFFRYKSNNKWLTLWSWVPPERPQVV